MPCGGLFRRPVSDEEPAGSPKFLNASRHACHALRWTPADPRGPHRIFGPSVLASATVNNVAVCIKRHDGAVSSFGEYGLSCGLHVSLCTLQLTCSALPSAVAVATLGRSGWLILTPQGLSPCKKRQALLGAPTILPLSRERRESYLQFGHDQPALLVGLQRLVMRRFPTRTGLALWRRGAQSRSEHHATAVCK